MKFITCHSETWKLDSKSPNATLLAEVDLSSYCLSERPVVTAGLHGDKRGECSLGMCSETEQGFTVSLTFSETAEPRDERGVEKALTPALAEELGLSVYWIVIGT